MPAPLMAALLSQVGKTGRQGGDFISRFSKGGGGDRFLGPPATAFGELSDSLTGLLTSPPGIDRLPQPPAPGQLPGAVSGERLLGIAPPGVSNLPGVGGFTSLMDNILGFGGNNGYGGLSQQDWINTQVGAGNPNAVNPYASLLSGLFGRGRQGPYYG